MQGTLKITDTDFDRKGQTLKFYKCDVASLCAFILNWCEAEGGGELLIEAS